MRKGKFSLNTSVGASFRDQISFGSALYETTDESLRSQVSAHQSDNRNVHPRVNIKSAYQINEKQKITFGVRAYGSQSFRNQTDSTLYYQNNELLSRKDELLSAGGTWLSGSSFLNYMIETDTNKSNLEFNLNYKIKVNEGFSESRNSFYEYQNQTNSSFDIRNESRNRPNIGEFRATYEHVFDTTGWKWSGGGSYSIVYNGQEFTQYNFVNDDWIEDPLYTNSFDYTEQNGSAFTEVTKDWEKISIRGGVSAEYTGLNGYSNSLDQQFIDSTYFMLFPSGSVMFKPLEKLSITTFYSSGIRRPRFDNYDPFVRIEDSLTITYGNPYLLPEVRQSVGVDIDFFYQYNLSVTYNFAQNSHSTLSFVDETTFLLNQTPWNLDRNDGVSVSLSVPLKTKWFSGWNSIWLNYNKYTFPEIFEREDFVNITYGLWSYSTFTLPKEFSIINRLYVGKWGSETSKNNVIVDWGIRLNKKMFDRKFQLWAEVSDIIAPTNEYESIQTNFVGSGYNRWAFTSFKIGLFYKFGRLKQAENIQESSSGQSDRI